jgi:hypothetical protein
MRDPRIRCDLDGDDFIHVPDLLLMLQYYGGDQGQGCAVADGSAAGTAEVDKSPACLEDCFIGGIKPTNDEGWCAWLTPQSPEADALSPYNLACTFDCGAEVRQDLVEFGLGCREAMCETSTTGGETQTGGDGQGNGECPNGCAAEPLPDGSTFCAADLSFFVPASCPTDFAACTGEQRCRDAIQALITDDAPRGRFYDEGGDAAADLFDCLTRDWDGQQGGSDTESAMSAIELALMEEINGRCAIKCEYPTCRCPEGKANPPFITFVVAMQECSALRDGNDPENMDACQRSEACAPGTSLHDMCEPDDTGVMVCAEVEIPECHVNSETNLNFIISYVGDVCPTQVQDCRTTGDCWDGFMAAMDESSDGLAELRTWWDGAEAASKAAMAATQFCMSMRPDLSKDTLNADGSGPYPGFPYPLDTDAPFCSDDDVALVAATAATGSFDAAAAMMADEFDTFAILFGLNGKSMLPSIALDFGYACPEGPAEPALTVDVVDILPRVDLATLACGNGGPPAEKILGRGGCPGLDVSAIVAADPVSCAQCDSPFTSPTPVSQSCKMVALEGSRGEAQNSDGVNVRVFLHKGSCLDADGKAGVMFLATADGSSALTSGSGTGGR